MDLQSNKPGEGMGQGLQYVNYKKSAPATGAPSSYSKPFKPAPGYGSSATPKHHLWTTITTIALLLLILVGVAYMIYGFVLSPDRTIQRALSRFDRAPQIHSNVGITIDSASPQLKDGSFSIITDAERPTGAPVRADSVIDLATPGLSGTAEIRFSDNTFYFNVIRMPEQLSNLRPLANLWYSASSDSVSAFLGAHTSPVGQKDTSLNFQGLYQRLVSLGIISSPELIGLGSYGGTYVWRYESTVQKDVLITELTAAGSNLPEMDQIISFLQNIEFKPIIISVGLVSGDIEGITMDMNVTAPSGSGILSTVSGAHLTIGYVFGGGTNVKAPPSATSLDTSIASMLLPPPAPTTKKK